MTVVDGRPHYHIVLFLYNLQVINKYGYLGKGFQAEGGMWWMELG